MLRRCLLSVLLAALLAPASAPAATLDGGTSKLTFDRGLLALLSEQRVRVVSDPPARVAGRRSIALPITGGDVAPSTGQGHASHRGAVILRRGDRVLSLAFPRLRLARGGTLSVRAAGARVTLARVITSRLRVRRQGVDTLLQGVRLELTRPGARLIERALRIDGPAAGAALGQVTMALRFREVIVSGGGTTIALDPGFVEALALEDVSLTTSSPTEVRPEGLLFPIVSGSVGRGTVAGGLRHLGGLGLAEEDTRLELERFDIDIGPVAELTALVGTTRMRIADIDLTSAAAGPGTEPRTFVLRNLVLRLTEGAAQAFIDAFQASEFYPGQIMGTATVVARAR